MARSPEGGVARVRSVGGGDGARGEGVKGAVDQVLRWGPGVRAELAVATRIAVPGLVVPQSWGRFPDGTPYSLRPFVAGRPFGAAIAAADGAPVARWVGGLLTILEGLHAHGVLHRDIKSANVLVDGDDVHLLDLDLAVRRDAGADGAGSALHIAPEVLLGREPSEASDLFSVGAMVALAFGGAPRADFHDRFPARSFWDASGLDPARVPDELRPLIGALVSRAPGDRPSSAREARRRLPSDAGRPPPDLRLPWLAGRADALDAIASAARAPGVVVVVSVDGAEDRRPLLDAVQVACAAQGCAVTARAEEPGGDGVTTAAEGRSAAFLDLAWSGLVAGSSGPRTGAGATVVLALSADAAQALHGQLEPRLLPAERERFVLLDWPIVAPRTVRDHLLALGGDASPELTERLARSLHARTGGRRAWLDELLSHAVDDGVLAPTVDGYTPLLGEWPDTGRFPAPDRALPDDLGPAARRALEALGCLDGSARRSVVAAAAELDDAACTDAEVELRRRGVLRVSAVGRDVAWSVSDPAWLHSARAALVDEARWTQHERCADALETAGAPRAEVGRHRLAAALGAGRAAELDLSAWLDVADVERKAGRAGGARRLLGDIRTALAARGEAVPEWDLRCEVLGARLDIAQGNAEEVWAGLEARHGNDLAGAPGPLAIVAALAAEQAGHRDAARRLYAAVADRATATPGERTWARLGLAFGRLLDGDLDGAARLADGDVCPPSRPGVQHGRAGGGDGHTPHGVAEEHARGAGAGHARDVGADEALVGLANIRGIVASRRGRLDEARAHYEHAAARARAAGDLGGLARALLNRGVLERRRAPDDAAAWLRRACDAFTEAGHVPGRALALHDLGVVLRDLGDLAGARRHLEEAGALRRRVGDAHGAATSLGSLALVSLDALAVPSALACLERAEALVAAGEYRDVAAFLALQEIGALALAGRTEEAAKLADDPLTSSAAERHPALAERQRALLAWVRGDGAGAIAAARRAHERAGEADDVAELYRSAALWAALEPSEPSRAALAEAGARWPAGAEVRRIETAWRLAGSLSELDADSLESWWAALQRAGRVDLARSVSLAAAALHDAAGRRQARRRARARAAAATDSLTDGLPPAERRAAMERITTLAGGPLAGAPAGGLGIAWFLEFNRRMAADRDLEGLLRTIVDAALEITGARRGFLMLLDERGLEVEVARGVDKAPMPAEEVRFSRSLVERAIGDGRPLLLTDASRDERFAAARSISSMHLRSVLCVPFGAADGARGALYVDDDLEAGAFDDADVDRVRALADQASIAITNLRRRHAIEELNQRLTDRVEFQEAELQHTRRLLERQGEVPPIAGLVGESDAIRRVHRLLRRFAPTDLPVLVTGASGTGKDLAARALHELSGRASGPLVVENVAALPAQLLESEMFGHVRGAFTGADRDRPGLFAEADGGTFVLDEIGEMPLELQAKLLRVLESGEFRPVGSRRSRKVDVRIVASTNRDLLACVREGTFREDLYYRLDAAEVVMPPLSERVADIPLLAQHFLERLNEKHGCAKRFSDAVLVALARRPWPGNVRELANEVARLHVLSEDVIDEVELLRRAAGSAADAEPGAATAPASLTLEDAERSAIERALAAAGGRKDRAARLLGISRAGLYAKLKRLGVGDG